jgi:MarR family transcriptional regulator for hemolysin
LIKASDVVALDHRKVCETGGETSFAASSVLCGSRGSVIICGMHNADPHAIVMGNLVQASRKWRKLAQLALAAHGISQARAAALVWAHRLGGGIRQISLAGYVGIEGTSLVRLLDELSAADLIVRKDDPNDRRAKTIWLTSKGEQLAEQIEAVLAALRDRVLEGVAPSDIDAALRICNSVDRAAKLMCSGSSPEVSRLLVDDIPIEATALQGEEDVVPAKIAARFKRRSDP